MRKFETSALGKLVISTFDKKEYSHIPFTILTRFSRKVLFILINNGKLLLFLTIYLEFGEANLLQDKAKGYVYYMAGTL